MFLEKDLVCLCRNLVLLGLSNLLNLLGHVLEIAFLPWTLAALLGPCLIHAEPLISCLGISSRLLVTMVHSS